MFVCRYFMYICMLVFLLASVRMLQNDVVQLTSRLPGFKVVLNLFTSIFQVTNC